MNKNYFVLGVLSLIMWGSSCKSEHKHTPVNKDTVAGIMQKDSNLNRKLLPAENQYVAVDLSPMDMSYYPVNYPQLKLSERLSGKPMTAPVMRVIYSRPHLHGRKLYPEVFKYDTPWRLGANEATEIQFFKSVIIDKKTIPAGRYSIYAIPEKDSWTIAINKNLDDWGLNQDSTKDIIRVKIPVTYNNPHTEYFTMLFEDVKSHKANLIMAWDDAVAKLPIIIK